MFQWMGILEWKECSISIDKPQWATIVKVLLTQMWYSFWLEKWISGCLVIYQITPKHGGLNQQHFIISYSSGCCLGEIWGGTKVQIGFTAMVVTVAQVCWDCCPGPQSSSCLFHLAGWASQSMVAAGNWRSFLAASFLQSFLYTIAI